MLNEILQKRIIFHPVSLPAEYPFAFNYPFEELFLDRPDGARLNGLLFKTKSDCKGLIFYCHGNADNLARWGNMHRDFTSQGYDFFVWDYRQYGKSTGELKESFIYEDALSWYIKLKPEKKYNKQIIYGRSLGSPVAASLAAEINASQVILETPFDNMKDLFKTHVPIIPKSYKVLYNFPTDQYLKRVAYPICIFHGTKDRVVPYASAERLKKVLKPADQFITIPGGSHSNLGTFSAYQQTLKSILD